MELIILQETSITLTELDAMDNERKWRYFYWIQAAKEKELRDLEEAMNKNTPQKGGKSAPMSFPDTFVSKMNI